MFKLLKISDFYVLTDGTSKKVTEDEKTITYSMSILATTKKIEEAENLKLLEIDNIDLHILEDDDNSEWEVQVDMEFNVYLDKIMEKEKKEGHGHLAKVLSQIMTKQYEMEYPPSSRKVFNYSFSKKEDIKREEIRSVLKEMLSFDTILTADPLSSMYRKLSMIAVNTAVVTPALSVKS